MAIKGSLREASLPDVLQLLSLGQKTGCLALTDRSNFGYIYFDQGRICYSSIVNRRDRLGDLLVKNGLIRPDQLQRALDVQAARQGERLGEILIESGAITRQQLEHYIRVQIEEAVYFLFTWTQGSFYFEVDERPEHDAFLVSINPENLLLEGARRVDEWSLIEKRIPSLDMVFGLDPSVDGRENEDLTAEQRKILPFLDGRRSVRDIIDEVGLVEFEVGKALFGLLQAGLAHPAGKKAARTAEESSPARIEEHRNLGVAFYRTGMFDESVREFLRVLELQESDLDARFYLGLIRLRQDDARGAIRYLMELVEAGGRWASVFHAMGLALERLGRLEDALAAVEEAARLKPGEPKIVLTRGILLAKLGRSEEACEAFALYREMLPAGGRPPAAFFAFSVIAEASAGRAAEAVKIGEEGVQMHPHSGVLHLHLGAVHERAGSWDEAERLYRRAADEDPGLPQAQKSLGDALYRRAAYDEASAAYEMALKHAPGLGDDVLFKLGNIRYKRGEHAKAVDHWRAALERNPENGIARTNLELVERAMAGARS
jgi:tetratricopeptide (TPR) repeat protein